MRMTNVGADLVVLRLRDAPETVSTDEKLAAGRFVRGQLRCSATQLERSFSKLKGFRHQGAAIAEYGLAMGEILGSLDMMAETVPRYAAIFPELDWDELGSRVACLHEDVRVGWRP